MRCPVVPSQHGLAAALEVFAIVTVALSRNQLASALCFTPALFSWLGPLVSKTDEI